MNDDSDGDGDGDGETHLALPSSLQKSCRSGKKGTTSILDLHTSFHIAHHINCFVGPTTSSCSRQNPRQRHELLHYGAPKSPRKRE